MDTENKNVEMEQTVEVDTETGENDALKEAMQATFEKLRRQSMLLGFQVSSQTILDKITAFERKPGSKSNNDHKRLIKDIKNFCEIAVSRKVNTDGETEPIEETAQN